MLTVLGGLAEFERELIRARTGEGSKRAQERGVRFGGYAAALCAWRSKSRLFMIGRLKWRRLRAYSQN
jgi:DNA invertase Pin-like site-specific DNA recombinase